MRALLLSLFAVWSVLAAAQQPCFDKVAVSEFTIAPEKLSADQAATFRAVITNNCSTPLDVPWEVRESYRSAAGATIAAGRTTVPASSTAVITASSGDGVMMFDGKPRLKAIADDGSCSFWFVADPYDDVRDSMKTNNVSAKITRFVAPALRTMLLSLDLARAYRAGASGRTLPGSQCSAVKIVVMNTETTPYTLRASLDCTGGTMGGRATVEAFTTFLMKNGYRVKGLRRYFRNDAPDVCNNSRADEAAGHAGVAFDAPPVAGSDSPYFKAQLWVQGRRSIVACFALDVIGPVDFNDPGARSPYHCDAAASGWNCETGMRP